MLFENKQYEFHPDKLNMQEILFYPSSGKTYKEQQIPYIRTYLDVKITDSLLIFTLSQMLNVIRKEFETDYYDRFEALTHREVIYAINEIISYRLTNGDISEIEKSYVEIKDNSNLFDMILTKFTDVKNELLEIQRKFRKEYEESNRTGNNQ